MKSWSETLHLPRRLKDARPTVSGAGPSAPDALERERAAFERGRLEGERALGEQLIRQRSELIELQQGVITSMRQTIGQVARESETACIQLALEVARKVVAGLPVSAEAIEAAVTEAISDVDRASEIVVLLNAEDFVLLQRQNSPMLLSEAGGDRFRLEPSSEVTRGGCMVRTSFGAIDARRETKFNLLERSLLN